MLTFQGEILAEGTYQELLKTHLAALSTMESEDPYDEDNGGDFETETEKDIKKETSKMITIDLLEKQEVLD
jgi:hypothetical protein